MKRRLSLGLILTLVLCLLPLLAQAAPDMPAITATNTGKGTQYSLTLQLLALMTTLSVLPSVAAHDDRLRAHRDRACRMLRQALGTGQTPPNMVHRPGCRCSSPCLSCHRCSTDWFYAKRARCPYIEPEGLSFDKALAAGRKAPLRAFMLLSKPAKTTSPCSWTSRATRQRSPALARCALHHLGARLPHLRAQKRFHHRLS
jgi:flagellar biosynthesis protein FliP